MSRKKGSFVVISDYDPHRKVKKWGQVKITCITCRGKGTYHGQECGLCKGKRWIYATP
jgi:DnaJ-class molecular chaperone